MLNPTKIPFQQLIDALLDEKKPFSPRFYYRLSGLNETELAIFETTWSRVATWRRQAFMEDLAEMGSADYLLDYEGICRVALKDSDPVVRLSAVKMLSEYEEQDLIPAFLEMIEAEKNNEVRAATAAALGSFVYLGELEEIPVKLLHQIEDCLLSVTQCIDTALVRRRALESLGFSSRKEVIPLIQAAFESKEKDWQVSALLAMGRSANSLWNPQVLAMLDHPRPPVRAEAVTAAGELEIADAVPKLMELLGDVDDEVRAAAIWALSQIGGEEVRETLEEMLENTEDEDEAELLDAALENLSFTEDFQPFSLLNILEDAEDFLLDDKDNDDEESLA